MEFTCPRARLYEALSIVGAVVPARSAKPILQNIHFSSSEGNVLVLSATDYDVGVKYELEVDSVSEPEDVVLPAVRLINIVRDAWGDSITVKVKDNKAEILTQGAKFELLGEPAEDFPSIPSLDEENCFTIQADDLAGAIQQTTFATAREEDRYALAGVNMSVKGDLVELVTTDTFRLALSSREIKGNGSECNAIVLLKGMLELSKLIAGEEEVKISLSDTQFFARTSRATLVSRLIEGKFPNYENVMPKDLGKKVSVNRERLMQALRQAANMSNEETRAVNVVAHDSTLELKSASMQGGEAFVEIDAVLEGGEVSVNFNYVYLVDVLKILKDETITLQLRDRESPGRIDTKGYTYVVSPICPKPGEEI